MREYQIARFITQDGRNWLWTRLRHGAGGLRRDRRGAAAIVTAMALPALMGAAGLAVDIGVWHVESSRLQLAADIAAVSAAKFLPNTQIQTADLQAVVQTTIADMTGNTLIGTLPTAAVTMASDRSSLTVTLNNRANTYFTGMFVHNGPAMSATATAGAVGGWGSTPCVLAVGNGGSNPVGIDVENEGSITATGCSVFSNSPAQVTCTQAGAPNTAGSIYVRNGSIVASRIAAVGTVCAATWNGATTLTPSGQSGAEALTESEIELDVDKPEAEDCATYAQGWTNGGILNLSPGTYCGDLVIGNGMTVNFAPGVYYIKSGSLIITGGAKIGQANGVTFYLGGSNPGSVQIENDAQSSWDMTAPTTGPTAGILFWQDAGANGTAPDNIVTGSGGVTISGEVYMPYGNLNIINSGKFSYPTDASGNPTGYLKVVVNHLLMGSSGSGTLLAGGLPPTSTTMVLVQ